MMYQIEKPEVQEVHENSRRRVCSAKIKCLQDGENLKWGCEKGLQLKFCEKFEIFWTVFLNVHINQPAIVENDYLLN